jgi:ABC-2 type transport system permease protein
MKTPAQIWLVARREVRERVRSKGLWAGTAIMLLVVVASIVVPALAGGGAVTKHVGFTGDTPAALTRVVRAQGAAVDVTVRVHRFHDVDAGEAAVRDGDIDVLVVDGRLLEWRGRPQERLQTLVTGSIQLVALTERAGAVGLDADELSSLTRPVAVDNTQLGIAAGRTQEDETAAYLMSILLLIAHATFSQLVLTGVVQEKSSRVVEVLLARMPARNLLAGKIAGIGFLGFVQVVLLAVAALVATVVVDSVDVPAVSPHVLAWVIVWFVIGYAFYAVAYGAFGSLASRTEDASSVAAPATALLLVAYWASLIAVSGDPEGGWARLASLFPASAPYAMPARIALGTAQWWEAPLAATLALATTAVLVALAGRIYAGALLHSGPTLTMRDAWRRRSARSQSEEGARMGEIRRRLDGGDLIALALALVCGITVATLTSDVIVGVAVGAALYATAVRVVHAVR